MLPRVAARRQRRLQSALAQAARRLQAQGVGGKSPTVYGMAYSGREPS